MKNKTENITKTDGQPSCAVVSGWAPSAADFMIIEIANFHQWQTFGAPRTEQRIRMCLKLYPRQEAIDAITAACVPNQVDNPSCKP